MFFPGLAFRDAHRANQLLADAPHPHLYVSSMPY
jgi:hypothetical protein